MMPLDARSTQCFNWSSICGSGFIGYLETRFRLFVYMLYSYAGGILKLCLGQQDLFMHGAKIMLKRLQECTLVSDLPSDSALLLSFS